MQEWYLKNCPNEKYHKLLNEELHQAIKALMDLVTDFFCASIMSPLSIKGDILAILKQPNLWQKFNVCRCMGLEHLKVYHRPRDVQLKSNDLCYKFLKDMRNVKWTIRIYQEGAKGYKNGPKSYYFSKFQSLLNRSVKLNKNDWRYSILKRLVLYEGCFQRDIIDHRNNRTPEHIMAHM